MLPYLFLILLELLLILINYRFNCNKKLNLLFLLTLTICYSFLLGFRSPTVGIDTSTYLKFYHGTSISDYVQTQADFEIGYSYLSKTFAKFNIPFSIFLFVISFATYFFISLFCYRTTKHSLILFTVINCLGIGNLVFSAIRQIFALGIMLVGFVPPKKLEEHLVLKNLYSTIFIILGSLFHYSALIGLILLIIHNIRIKKKLFYFILFISLVICIISPWFYVFIYRNTGSFSYAYFPDFSTTPYSTILYFLILFFLIFFSNFENIQFLNKILTFLDKKMPKSHIFTNLVSKDSKNIYSNKNNESILLFIVFTVIVLCIGLTGLIFSRFIYFIIPFVALAFIKIVETFNHKSLTFLSIAILLFGSIFYFFVTGILLDSLRITPYSFGYTL